MKYLLSIVLSLFVFEAFSQNLVNRKVISVTASDIFGNVYSGQTFSNGIGSTPNKNQGIRATFAGNIGKFNSHNVAVLYGIEIPLRFTHTSTQTGETNETEYGFFPSISILKMISITNSVFIGSTVGLRAGYQKYHSSAPETINTWDARVIYRPLDFIWYFRKETALTLGIWDGYIEYNNATTTVPSTNNAKLKTNSLMLNARFNLTFGVQFLLHH